MVAWSGQGEGDGKLGEWTHSREIYEVKGIGLGVDWLGNSDAR